MSDQPIPTMQPAPEAAPRMLPPAQTLLLHCIRTWCAARGAGCAAHGTAADVPAESAVGAGPDGEAGRAGGRAAAGEAVLRALGRIDAGEAAPFLENFLSVLLHAARRGLQVGAPGQRRVGGDERLLLGVLAFAQEGRPAEALLLLRGMVRSEHARLVLRNAEGLATELALAGRYLAAADLALPPATVH